MKLRVIFLFILATSLYARSDVSFYAGPHFNYTRLYFNNPSYLHGYLAGVSAGFKQEWCNFFYSVDFEGSWDAGPITGVPCERSDLTEYFLELKLATNMQWSQLCFSPYTGFGWDRFENRQDLDPVSFEYCYTKLFVPVGFTLSWNGCDWKGGLQLEFRPDVDKWLKVVGLDLNPNWGYAVRAQLPFNRYYCSRSFVLSIIPFFDWNQFGQVQMTNFFGGPLAIPRLLLWNLGLRTLIGYEF